MKLFGQFFLTAMFILTGLSAVNSIRKVSKLKIDYKFSNYLTFKSGNLPKMAHKIIKLSPESVKSLKVEKKDSKKSFIQLDIPEKKSPVKNQNNSQNFQPIVQQAITPEKIVIRPDTTQLRRKIKILIKHIDTESTITNEPNN
jgi:hypothetical protein